MKEAKEITRLKKPIIVHGDDRKESLGLVHVYTGDGKGKTTAALGLAMRAAGNGLKVYIIQFLKACETGELVTVEKLPNVTMVQFGVGMEGEMQRKITEYEEKLQKNKESGTTFAFLADMDEETACRKGFEHAKKIIASGDYDLVILDELNCVLNKGLIAVEEALELMKRENHPQTELVLTGWGAPEEIKQAADYVSFVQRIKHPYDRGIKARRGIEY